MKKKSHGKHLNFFWDRLFQNPEITELLYLSLQSSEAAPLLYPSPASLADLPFTDFVIGMI
jgi:hypothetical protein